MGGSSCCPWRRPCVAARVPGGGIAAAPRAIRQRPSPEPFIARAVSRRRPRVGQWHAQKQHPAPMVDAGGALVVFVVVVSAAAGRQHSPPEAAGRGRNAPRPQRAVSSRCGGADRYSKHPRLTARGLELGGTQPAPGVIQPANSIMRACRCTHHRLTPLASFAVAALAGSLWLFYLGSAGLRRPLMGAGGTGSGPLRCWRSSRRAAPWAEAHVALTAARVAKGGGKAALGAAGRWRQTALRTAQPSGR